MDDVIGKKGVAGERLLRSVKACRQVENGGVGGELREERSTVGGGVVLGKNGTVGGGGREKALSGDGTWTGDISS